MFKKIKLAGTNDYFYSDDATLKTYTEYNINEILETIKLKVGGKYSNLFMSFVCTDDCIFEPDLENVPENLKEVYANAGGMDLREFKDFFSKVHERLYYTDTAGCCDIFYVDGEDVICENKDRITKIPLSTMQKCIDLPITVTDRYYDSSVKQKVQIYNDNEMHNYGFCNIDGYWVFKGKNNITRFEVYNTELGNNTNSITVLNLEALVHELSKV